MVSRRLIRVNYETLSNVHCFNFLIIERFASLFLTTFFAHSSFPFPFCFGLLAYDMCVQSQSLLHVNVLLFVIVCDTQTLILVIFNTGSFVGKTIAVEITSGKYLGKDEGV